MANAIDNSMLVEEEKKYSDKKEKIGISGGTLKIIAILTMAIDHIAAALYPAGIYSDFVYSLMRCIGRIAFPIFCFLLVEGFVHTRNKNKYAIRLILFAFISEIPFDLAFSGTMFAFYSQNVFFTLAIGFIAMMLIEHFKGQEQFAVIGAILAILLAHILQTDYDGRGVILIILFYLFRGKYIKISGSLLIFAQVLFGYTEVYALLSLIPINFYNGKRGIKLKYIFYIFYPAHLLLLYFILHTFLI